MRDKNGRFIRGYSGNPSGLPKQERLDNQGPNQVTPVAQPTEPVMPSGEHLDTWFNSVTGFGSAVSDKRQHTHFVANILSYHDAIELWRGDDIAARAIEMVPADCFRQGYDIHISDEGTYDDLKEDVEKKMSELKVDEIVERAYKYERAYGGGGILLGVDDGCTLDEPLVPEKIRGINWLTVLEPIEFYPATYYQDPQSPKYGEPEYYRLQAFTVSGAGTVIGVTDRRAPPPTTHLIHETRLVIFGGIRVSRYQRNSSLMGPLWGDSMLVRMMDVLRDFNIAWASAGILVTDFAQTVISMENLMALVMRQKDVLRERIRAMDMARSTARAVLIDSKETLKRESTNVQGLPDLLDRLSGRLAAAIDVPLSLLMGNTPKGIGADASQDVRLYYDRVQAVQRRRIAPVLKFIANLVIQTLRKRKIPQKWEIKFHPLWQLTDQEKSQARLTQARADSMYIKMGAVTSDEIRRSRFLGGYSFDTQIEEHKKAPGFLAPLPTGVLPGSTPGMMGKPGAPAAGGARPGAPKLMGPNAHSVSGYARRNPNQGRLGANPKEGGDKEPRHRDHLDDRPIVYRRDFAGIPIAVEVPAGTTLDFERHDGTSGTVTMQYDYGYVEGCNGADGGSLDVWLGPNEQAENAYLMHVTLEPEFSGYHQDKLMLGFDSLSEAKRGFLAHYDDERFYGGASEMPMGQFISIFGLMSRQQVAGKPAPGAEISETQSLHTMATNDAQAALAPGQSAPQDREQTEELLKQDGLGDDISQELKGDYPEMALRWINDIEWTGPVRVPLDQIDYSNRATWHASQPTEQEKVKKFAERVTTGWEKPILLVRRPDEPKLMVVDGHHRALAYEMAGKGALAYVGDAPTKVGPWDEFHAAQRTKSGKAEARAQLFRADSAVDAVMTSWKPSVVEETREAKAKFPPPIEAHMDRIIQRGSRWVVTSESGDKELGSYETKGEAVQRLRQVEYFRDHPDQAGKEDEITGGVYEQVTSGEVVHGMQSVHGQQESELLGFASDKPPERKASETPVWNEPLHTGSNPDDKE